MPPIIDPDTMTWKIKLLCLCRPGRARKPSQASQNKTEWSWLGNAGRNKINFTFFKRKSCIMRSWWKGLKRASWYNTFRGITQKSAELWCKRSGKTITGRQLTFITHLTRNETLLALNTLFASAKPGKKKKRLFLTEKNPESCLMLRQVSFFSFLAGL